MCRSVEPVGPDLPPPRARGGATAGAWTPVAERLAAWVDRALRPGGLAPRRRNPGRVVPLVRVNDTAERLACGHGRYRKPSVS